MKKSLMILSLILSANAFAGSIDYLAQQDAEYFAHPSMTGKIGVSSAFYNPAGTVFLEDGTYVQISTQTIDKQYEMDTKLEGTDKLKHKSDHPSALVPSIQIVKKEGNRAYFFHGGAAAGGGDVKYSNGISAFEILGKGMQHTFNRKIAKGMEDKGIDPVAHPEMLNATVDYKNGSKVYGSSYYFNTNFGMAQRINNEFSVAGGIRLMYVTRRLEGTAHYKLYSGNLIQDIPKETLKTGQVNVNIDSERTGYGVGGFVGFNYQPNEKLNVGFKYETEIELHLNADGKVETTSKNPLFTNKKDGASICDGITANLVKEPVIAEWVENSRRNLPAVMSLGAAYQATDRLTLLTSGNYYFIKDANRNGVYENYDNGYEVSIGLDYKLNDQFTFMTGYQYTKTGANEKTYKDTDYALDADMYGVGLKYTPDDSKEFVISYAYVDYKNGTSVPTYGFKGKENTTFKKTVQAVSLSAAFKF